MIFVTVGTTPFPFVRMSNLVYAFARENKSKFVLFQHGETEVKWNLSNVKKVKFLNFYQHKASIKKATSIISHGGPATIYLAVSFKKKPFVLPREKRYGEHINNHQLYFSTKLFLESQITLVTNLNNFRIRETLLPTPNLHVNNNSGVCNFLHTYIRKSFSTQ